MTSSGSPVSHRAGIGEEFCIEAELPGAGDGTRTRDALLGRQILTFYRSLAANPLKFSTPCVTQLYGENRAVAMDAGPPAMSRHYRVTSWLVWRRGEVW